MTSSTGLAAGETAAAGRGAGRPNLLHALLLATAGLPALAFLWGRRDGQVAFVVYREPKLAALVALGCILMAALAWGGPGELRAADLRARLRRPAWVLFALFLAWGLVTALWVEVPQNLFHELGPYALLLALVITLDAWADHDPAVPRLVELGLVASLGLAVAVGIVQTVVPIPILCPIDPLSAASNPSFFGYKNPMALAVAGQIFLLGRCFARARPARRAPLGFLLATEVAYLVALKSRTAWVALAGGALLLALLALARSRRPARRWAPIVVTAGIGGALFAAALAADPGLRWRTSSLAGYLAHPASFLQSDRGTYLLNTLNMVRFHPLGVGLGDWQTRYPLYRRVRRDLFTDTLQVRTAHGDLVQTLGETGWPGLVLWLGFFGILIATPAARCLRTGDLEAGFAAAQVAVLGLAMTTDAVVQHPYGKLQLFLVALLAVRAGENGGRLAAVPLPRRRGWPRQVPAAFLGVLAVAALFLAGCRLRKAWLAASARDLYLEVEERLVSRLGPPRLFAEDKERLAEVVRAGERLLAIPGYHRELCDDLLVLAHAELLLGHRQQALLHTRRSLELHPYNPSALSLMATAFADRPVKAGLWRKAHDHVLYEATHGFEGPYPGGWRRGGF